MACGLGQYNDLEMQTSNAACTMCAADTYGHKLGMTECMPCGTDAESLAGQTTCTCLGSHRVFSREDGRCTCESGYIYYDVLDQAVSGESSPVACQPKVNTRCPPGSLLAATGTCVDPTDTNALASQCTSQCRGSDNVASIDTTLLACTCKTYITPDEVCDESCRNQLPQLECTANSGYQLRDPSGTVTSLGSGTGGFGGCGSTDVATVPATVSFGHRNKREFAGCSMAEVLSAASSALGIAVDALEILSVSTRPVSASICSQAQSDEGVDALNAVPLSANNGSSTAGFVENSSSNVTTTTTMFANQTVITVYGLGSIRGLFADQDFYLDMFSTPSLRRRRAVDASSVPAVDNPVVCIQADQAVTFTLNPSNRNAYPVYDKDNLLNSNPSFDYGAFRKLGETLSTTTLELSYFTHQFSSSGFYVFNSNDDPMLFFYVRVVNKGEACPSGTVQPSTASALNLNGAAASEAPLAPDWTLIAIIMGTCGGVVLLLVAIVLVWRPKHWAQKRARLAPRYRALNGVNPLAVGTEDTRLAATTGGIQLGTSEGDESAAVSAGSNDSLFENFNVRTLYDKLEDQTLFLTTEMSKHNEDLRQLAENINTQTGDMKDMARSIDPLKISSAVSAERPTTSNAAAAAASKAESSLREAREAKLIDAVHDLVARITNGGSGPSTRPIRRRSSTHAVNTTAATALVGTEEERAIWREGEAGLVANEVEALVALTEPVDPSAMAVAADTVIASLLQPDAPARSVEDALDVFEATALGAEARVNSATAAAVGGAAEKRQDAKVAANAPIEDLGEVTAGLQALQAAVDKTASEATEWEAKSAQSASTEGRQARTGKMELAFGSALDSLGLTDDQKNRVMAEQEAERKTEGSAYQSLKQAQIARMRARVAERKHKRVRALAAKQEADFAKEAAALDAQAAVPVANMAPAAAKRAKQARRERLRKRNQQRKEAVAAEMDAAAAVLEAELADALDSQHVAKTRTLHEKALTAAARLGQVDRDTVAAALAAFQSADQEAARVLDSDRARQLAALKEKRANVLQRKREALIAAQAEEAANEHGFAEVLAVSVPVVTLGEEAAREADALERNQRRLEADMRRRHEEEARSTEEATEEEIERLQDEAQAAWTAKKQQILREKSNRMAAERAARTDLNGDQLTALMREHDAEMGRLKTKLDAEHSRSSDALARKLAKRREQKRMALQRRQELEATREMMDQKKELEEMQSAHMREAETEAMVQGVQTAGTDHAEDVVRAVLRQRHQRELDDLLDNADQGLQLEIDVALAKLSDRADAQEAQLVQQHEAELADLLSLVDTMSPAEMDRLRTEILERQNKDLELQHEAVEEEREIVSRDTKAAQQIVFAQSQLQLKERHYQEFADALRDIMPDHTGLSAEAEAAARELENVRLHLEKKRAAQIKQLEVEQERFAAEQEEQMAREMKSFEARLEEDRQRELAEAEAKKADLARAKQELLQQRREQMAEDMRKRGKVSDSDKKAIMAKHQEELGALKNTLDAERLRQMTALKEKRAQRTERKRRAKQAEMQASWQEAIKAHKEEARQREMRMQSDVINTLKEVEAAHGISDSPLTENEELNISPVSDESEILLPGGTGEAATGLDFVDTADSTSPGMSSTQAQELLKRLMTLESSMLQRARTPGTTTSALVELNDRDATWALEGDRPVEVTPSALSVQQYSVYYFGRYIIDLLTSLGYTSVELRIARQLPAATVALGNIYVNNSFRRSFFYDAKAGILYVRVERLTDVGEFLVMLVHCIAHISVGDLEDDRNPAFIREFHRALRVCGPDIAFGSAPAIDSLPSADAIESRFESCNSEEQRADLVKKLLGLDSRAAKRRALTGLFGPWMMGTK